MTTLVGPVAAFAVASIFYCYRHYNELQVRRERRLRERVAYMLWVAANFCVDRPVHA